MASGDLTTGTISEIDAQDAVAIAAAIDAINLALVTDDLFVVPINGGLKLKIFKVAREA
ncbi:hypothetical protein LCGC14_1728520 [marine sediment metagenome]|uniref:Uncharacterized protein n=1 Tax=marine sediment metagenome TaxID=412755 RepID=A0A0F9HY23_9ZZZZ